MLGSKNSLRRNLLALCLAVPWILLASVRIFALDNRWPLIPVAAFSPLILIAVSFPLLFALVIRARLTVILIGAFAIALAAMIVPRALPGPNTDADSRGREVTIMSANLLKGRASAATVERLARQNAPQVLALQEVTPEFVEELRADGLLKTYKYSVGTALPNVQGVLTLSTRPLDQTSQLGPDSWPEAIVGGTGLIVRNMHPSPPIRPGEATNNWKRLLAASPSAHPAVRGNKRVLVGDFNATLDHKDFRRVVERGYLDAADATGEGLNPTWSSSRVTKLVIDHVLVDNQLHISSYKVYDLPGSDHNAVIAKIRVPS